MPDSNFLAALADAEALEAVEEVLADADALEAEAVAELDHLHHVEAALLEELAESAGSSIQVILVVPCDMDPESRARLYNNLPAGISVQLLEEPYFPESFTPANGMVVSFGYMADERLMALPECYRMTDHYSGFWGRKVFIPYVVREDSTRFGNWMEVNPGKFSDVWRGE